MARAVASLILMLCLTIAPEAPAQTVSWTGAGDGTSWSDAANWNPQTIPGAGEEVVIDETMNSAYTVQLSTARTVARLRLTTDDVTRTQKVTVVR